MTASAPRRGDRIVHMLTLLVRTTRANSCWMIHFNQQYKLVISSLLYVSSSLRHFQFYLAFIYVVPIICQHIFMMKDWMRRMLGLDLYGCLRMTHTTHAQLLQARHLLMMRRIPQYLFLILKVTLINVLVHSCFISCFDVVQEEPLILVNCLEIILPNDFSSSFI